MPNRSRKRPRDVNQLAKTIVDLATGQATEPDPDKGKDPAAVALGRKGGLKGGKARAAKYDKLGVFKALSLLGSAIERKRVVGLEQYLPTLDRIIKNDSYMHTARTRASEIAEFIRSSMPPAQ